MVLITGASGQVGKALLQALSANGICTRAWVHRESQKEAALSSGASEVYVGDMAVREDAVQAMDGIDTIYFICNTANPREDEIGALLIDVAKRLGNITFVYHSVLHSLLSDMPHHKRKRNVEQALVDSGIPYMIFQPAVFMQMLLPSLQSVNNGGPFNQKFFTSNQTKMSYVDLKDYADAVAKMVVSKRFIYGTYEFCSEGAYSLAEMEMILSELTGRKVSSTFISDSEFLNTTHLAPDSYAGQVLLTMFHHYNESGFCGNAFTLTQILGQEPVTIRDYFQRVLRSK